MASIGVGDVTDILKQESTSRAIAGLGVYEFRRQLEYKAAEAGAEITVAERPFPSARLCKRLRRSGPKFRRRDGVACAAGGASATEPNTTAR